MDYKEFKELIIDYLSDNISDDKRQEFDSFLIDNSEYQMDFDIQKNFWKEVSAETPEPSTKMDMSFYSMLSATETKEQKISILDKVKDFFNPKLLQQFAYTIAILVFGILIGNQFNSSSNNSNEQIEMAQKETENVRSQLVLTLLDQPSANKRLQAVNEVNKLSKVTKIIIKALFTTLNKDENVNVRLSAIEALKKYTDIPEVREGLITSIAHQTSPLVQMELADLMVVLQEKKAVKSFEKLMEKEEVNSSAKEKIKESIQSII